MMRVGSVLVALMAPAMLHGQAPEPTAQQPPVFGVTVDIVALDASVVDADGRPVLGLGPEDFRVEVDGRPRRLVSVEYVGRDLEPPRRRRPVRRTSAPTRTRPGTAHPAGRRPRQHRPGPRARRAQGRGPLPRHPRPGRPGGPGFRPRAGRGIEFTAEVGDIRRGLKGVVGTADRGGYRVPLAESISYIKNANRQRWEEFVALQCGGTLPGGRW